MSLSTGDEFERPRDFLVDAMRDVFLGTASELGRRIDRAGYYAPTPSQVVLMSLLPMDGIRITELARRAQVSKQAVDQAVDQLEKVGVLVRVPDATDGRARIVRPTPYAKRGYAVSRRILTEIHDEWRRLLGDELYGQLERAVMLLRPITPAPRGLSPRGPLSTRDRRSRRRPAAGSTSRAARGRGEGDCEPAQPVS